jgi:hypothetical protein
MMRPHQTPQRTAATVIDLPGLGVTQWGGRWAGAFRARGAKMWSTWSEELRDARGSRFTVALDSRPATFAEVVRAWQADAGFRSLFNAALANAPYSAFRWETPAITVGTLSRPFEFVLLDSPGLARRPDAEAFAEHFVGAVENVVTFYNLGKDAIMVVPCPVGNSSVYGHLATFVRLAPEQQLQALWRCVGTAMARRIGSDPVWLNTAGAGVSWLHVRLDDRPKYYGFAPYRKGHVEPGTAPDRVNGD